MTKTPEDIIRDSTFFKSAVALRESDLKVFLSDGTEVVFPAEDGVHYEVDFCDNGTLIVLLASSSADDVTLSRYAPIQVLAFSPDKWLSVGKAWPKGALK